jgi:hypothetical protein
MTLWMGYGQTTKNDNGDCAHSRFPGFAHIPYPIHRVLVNWTPAPLLPYPCRMEAGAGTDDPTMTEHGIYVPGHPFAIFIQVSNREGNGCI